MSSKREISRAQKALRHAQKRGRSEYIQGRIATHIKQTQAIAEGKSKVYSGNTFRQTERRRHAEQERARQQALLEAAAKRNAARGNKAAADTNPQQE